MCPSSSQETHRTGGTLCWFKVSGHVSACIFQPWVGHEKIKSTAGLNISGPKWRTKAFTELTTWWLWLQRTQRQLHCRLQGELMLLSPDMMDEFSLTYIRLFHSFKTLAFTENSTKWVFPETIIFELKPIFWDDDIQYVRVRWEGRYHSYLSVTYEVTGSKS